MSQQPRQQQRRRGARGPRLSIRGPVSAGIITFLAAGGAVLHIATVTTVGASASSSAGGPMGETASATRQAIPVAPARGGVVGRVLASEGRRVEAGEVLITLDASQIDRRIAELRLRSEVARDQLAEIRHRALAAREVIGTRPEVRREVETLERQVAEVEVEAQELTQRIAAAELELMEMSVRAPASGRLVGLTVRGAGQHIAANTTVARIEIDGLSDAARAGSGRRRTTLADVLIAPVLRASTQLITRNTRSRHQEGLSS